MTTPISTIVSAISDDVVAGLSLLGLPPLTDGAILLGSAMVAQQGAPPRVVFEPLSVRFGPADRSTVASSYPGGDLLAVLQARPLGTALTKFRVHVWGIGDPTPGSFQSPTADIDATFELLRCVLRSCLRLNAGIVAMDGGVFANSQRGSDALLAVNGWYCTVQIEIPIPITDYPLGFANEAMPAPGGVVGVDVQTQIQPGDGSSPELGPLIEIPSVP